MDLMNKIKQLSKCPICRMKVPTGTIFQHVSECDDEVRFRARMLIAELEVELREQG